MKSVQRWYQGHKKGLFECVFWFTVLAVLFIFISWVGGVGALLIQGEFLKSIGLFILGPTLITVGITIWIRYDKNFTIL